MIWGGRWQIQNLAPAMIFAAESLLKIYPCSFALHAQYQFMWWVHGLTVHLPTANFQYVGETESDAKNLAHVGDPAEAFDSESLCRFAATKAADTTQSLTHDRISLMIYVMPESYWLRTRKKHLSGWCSVYDRMSFVPIWNSMSNFAANDTLVIETVPSFCLPS